MREYHITYKRNVVQMCTLSIKANTTERALTIAGGVIDLETDHTWKTQHIELSPFVANIRSDEV